MTTKSTDTSNTNSNNTDPNLDEDILIVDRSGSMRHRHADTVGGINTYIETRRAKLKEEGRRGRITIVQFDFDVETVIDNMDINDVPTFNVNDHFVPRGSTALNDAIGMAFNEVGIRLANTPAAERPSTVIASIFTDGHENASREFTLDQVQQMIKTQQEDYSWLIMYIGVGDVAERQGQTLGIPAHLLNNTGATGRAAAQSMASLAAAGTRYSRARARGFTAEVAGAAASFTNEERARMGNPDYADNSDSSDEVIDPKTLRGKALAGLPKTTGSTTDSSTGG